MAEQLIKHSGLGYSRVYPKTFTKNIIDEDSGLSLEEILSNFNCYFLVYVNNELDTRLLVPSLLRKTGLWITYVKNHRVILEYYIGNSIDDESWANNSHWALASNFLVGDVSVSANGTWIVNGLDTGVLSKGEDGIAPLLLIIDNKLSVSYNNGIDWEYISDYISPKFRWIDTTEIEGGVGKILLSMDLGNTWSDLSPEFSNSISIKGYVSSSNNLPNNAVIGDIYGVGPTYNEEDTEEEFPIYNIYVKTSEGWIDNGSLTSLPVGLVQLLGDNEDKVISLKVVSDNIIALRDRLVVLSEEEFELLEEKDADKFYFIYEEES